MTERLDRLTDRTVRSVDRAASWRAAGRSAGWRVALAALLAGILVWLWATRGAPLSIPAHALGPGFEAAAAGLGAWLALVIGGWSLRQRRLDLFELPTWISLNIYGQVVLNVWLLQRDWHTVVPWLVEGTSEKMVQAVLLFGVGLTALWAGYVWSFTRLARRPVPLTSSEPRMRLPAVIAIWIAGWLIGNTAIVTGLQGYLASGSAEELAWNNYLAFASVVTAAATGALAMRHFRRPTPWGWLWLTLMVGSIILSGLVVGTRGISVSILAIATFYYYAKRRLPWLWLVAGAVMVIAIVPVVNQYRRELLAINTGHGVALPGRLTALGDAARATLTQDPDALLGATTDTFEQRQGSLLEVSASVMTLHPQVLPFVGAELVEYVIPQFIPRALWPDKPSARPELYYITTTYMGSQSEHTFTAIGQFADMYRAGGWPALVTWFVLFGAFGAWLYRRGPQAGSLPGTILYVVMLIEVLPYETDATTVLLHLVQFMPLLWILIGWVLFAPADRRAAPAGADLPPPAEP